MRIAFLLQKSASDVGGSPLSLVTLEIIAHLHRMGAQVDLITPEAAPLDIGAIRPRHDLYVLKSKTPLTLSLAGALTRAGAEIVNTAWSSGLARDKIAATAILAASDVPVPPSWATGGVGHLQPVLKEGPLWIKPPQGSRGVGVRRLSNVAELDGLETLTDSYGLPLPLFAQREAPSNGRDLKVYVVGEQVWAITRPFPAQTLEDKLGEFIPLSPKIRTAALRVGQALGLELYGVDFLSIRDQFSVVDVNAFPGYKGVAEAPHFIAQYLYERARRAAVQ